MLCFWFWVQFSFIVFCLLLYLLCVCLWIRPKPTSSDVLKLKCHTTPFKRRSALCTHPRNINDPSFFKSIVTKGKERAQDLPNPKIYHVQAYQQFIESHCSCDRMSYYQTSISFFRGEGCINTKRISIVHFIDHDMSNSILFYLK